MKITQAEARRLRARVRKLEKLRSDLRYAWGKEWPEGRTIANLEASSTLYATISTARTLRHAVMVTAEGNRLFFTAALIPEITEEA